jgi:hypothetical protein
MQTAEQIYQESTKRLNTLGAYFDPNQECVDAFIGAIVAKALGFGHNFSPHIGMEALLDGFRQKGPTFGREYAQAELIYLWQFLKLHSLPLLPSAFLSFVKNLR